MSGQFVRYPNYVRVCYLLLGWWYLALAACFHKRTGKPRKKETYMSKNLTRKGLAFGAGLALVASGFAAVPAQADTTGPVTLAPDQGTTFNSILQSGITLKTELDANEFGVEEAGSLAFLVENPGAAAISLDLATAGALNEQVNYRSDTNWAATGISPAATRGARLNGEATTTAADDDLWAASTYAADNAKFAYVTGSSDQTVATYAAAIAAGTAEAHVFDEVVATDIDGADLITLTLANGSVLTYTPDATPTGAEIQAGLRLDGDYDANYAVVTVADGSVDVGNADNDTFDFTVTYAKVQGDVGLSTLNAFGGAQTIDTNTAGAPSTFNFGTTAKKNTLTVATTETAKNVTLYVTAFLDENGNGVKDTFEDASDRVTVVLYAPSNVSATTTIDYLVADNSAYRTKIVYNNSINPWFVQAKTFNKLYKEGVLVDIADAKTDTSDTQVDDYAATAITDTTVAYSSETTIGITKNTLMGGVNTSGVGIAYNLNAGNTAVVDLDEGVFTAQTFYTTDGTEYVAIGAASPAIDTNGTTNTLVDTLEPTVTDTANLKFVADSNSASAVTVRTGTKTFDVAVQALDDSATPKTLKAAGIKVKATVTAATLDSGAVSVTGSSASLVEDGVTVAYGFTNASGIATFSINNTVGSEDDVVTAKFEILNSSGVWVDADTVTATWADATLASWKAVGGNYTSGATVNLTFAAYDQWGEPVSTDDDAALSVSAVASFAGIADATKYSKTVAVTNGVAEYSFANFAAAGASAQLVATLKAGTSNATPTNGSSATITVNVYNTNATDKIVVADTFQTAINYNDYVTGKTSSSAVTAAATKSGIATAAKATITGNVLDVNGVGQPGVAVTVAAAGVLLKDASAYAEDTITTYSNEYGSFSVDVFAHELNTAGIAVSITADGKTASTKVKTFLPAAIDDKNLSFSWNFPANVVKNTTYAVTAKLTDKWGNPIAGKDAQGNQDATDFAIAFQGTGSIEVNGVGTTVYRDFNTKGEVTVFVRSIKDIAGPGSVSATLGGNALYATGETSTSTSQLGTVAATIALNDEATVWDESLWASTLSVEVDVLDRAPAASATGKVNVGSFNGKLVVYAAGLDGAKISWKVAGKWGTAVASGNLLNRFDRPVGASGVNVIVEIYVNGVKQLTKTVLTR